MALLRESAKRVAFAALANPLAVKRRLKRLRASQAVTILNLHRVAEDDGSHYRPLSPKLFDALLTWLKREFAIVTFGEIDQPRTKPKLILSFDDGYRDFIRVTVPLLGKHGIRVNQNIIPASVESGLPPLNVMAEDFVGMAPAELVARLDVPGFRPTAPGRLGRELSAFIKNRSHAGQKELADILVPQFRAWDGFQPTPMMTLDEVRQIAGVHELGGHSYDHASMEFESDAYVAADIERCRAFFRTALGQDMRLYAFPNGSCTDAQVALARSLGIEHVLLVGEAFDTDPHVHLRFTFDGRTWPEARFKALGRSRAIPQ